eukprot:TRINITY_DN1898_c0_g1_i2.p2 TRINITY_DN1898_c0_g1~~TRINITY_DN1898_c0_g1_i2.p2  ORF type:complete len:202 (+),score=34.79 TRINITY_DN1898_c0_g1_i2:1141-1746(+)
MHLSLSDQEMDDYIHLWRYLGYLLGIEDAYNVCTSRTVCEAYRAGFYALVPHLTAHPRKSSVQLVHSSIEGFGRFTGATPQLYVGILFSSDRSFLDIGWAELQPPTAFMSLLVRNMLEISAKSKPMKMLANAFFLHSALMDLWWPWLKRTVDKFNAMVVAPINVMVFRCGDLAYRMPLGESMLQWQWRVLRKVLFVSESVQ